MAIYKATYCYPFLDTIDPRTAIDLRNGDGGEPPHIFLKCKIDSSNKKVTGYSIRVLDGNNQQIFPPNLEEFTISPTSDLPQDMGEGINSGINGTYLYIPFFQNLHSPYSTSINSVKYNVQYQVQYIIRPDMTGADNSQSWTVKETEGGKPSKLTYSYGFDGMINGELVSIGDLVLVFDPLISNKTGIWRVSDEGSLKLVKRFEAETTILITQGDYHAECFIYTHSPKTLVKYEDAGWRDYRGNSWYDLFNGTSNHSYKWEITLYQGEGIKTVVPGVQSGPYYFMDYDNIKPIHYDMVLSSGSILGSSPSRIQISDIGENKLPSDSVTELVILQGRYIQLLGTNISGEDIESRFTLGSRAYIKNYDASYGHIYTLDGSVAQDSLDMASYCCFYKFSNDPNGILATDGRTKCATTKPVSLSGKVTNGKIDGYLVENNDLILVKNQSDAKTNGIYLYNDAGAWKRSGSFSTWGDFVGKIIYVENGAINGGRNFQSLAQAGGRLYIEGSALTGDSQLLFVEEKPIVIFPFLIKKEVTLYYDGVFPNLGQISEFRTDGYTLSSGDTLLMKIHEEDGQGNITSPFSYGIYQYRIAINDQDETVFLLEEVPGAWEENALYRITQGKTYGGQILNGRGLENSTPYIAKILKNSDTYTYISPYIGMQKRQMLFFTNGSFAYYDLPNAQSNALKILDVNTKFWKISHDRLVLPFLSYSNTDDNDTVPLQYNLCTFFRNSDQNPFYCYETPYLKLLSGEGGALDINVYQNFQLIPHEDNELLMVKDGLEQVLFSVLMPAIIGSGDRDITLEGVYRQGQLASWESYRWVLRNSQYKIVQDTGLKYDKDIRVSFYGLSNEVGNNVYFATLYVTDTLNNSLEITIKIFVDTDVKPYLPFSPNRFSATFDCDTHSVVLKSAIDDNLVSYYKREYKKYFAAAGRDPNGSLIYKSHEFKGEWTPVLLNTNKDDIRDFNITSDRSYQYVMISRNESNEIVQTYANTKSPNDTSGEAVKTHWGNWSLTELIPVDNDADVPSIKKAYKADINNVWLFKFALETGSQTQNLAKNEVGTLGRFSRVSTGATNALSGQVSCYLGSEIAPSSKHGYIERTRENILAPSTTNERVQMLQQWRSIAFSGNPKLLKDMKGESWIVAVTSNQNTPSNHIYKQPDQISFNWREVESSDNIIIYGPGDEIITKEGLHPEWFEK